MECHHIDQEADGGENTFENCIPLCFDHHAEVGHYSKEHPKGIKFTAAELRQHRDRWYAQITDGVAIAAPADYANLDRKLFEEIVMTLGGSNRMLHFKNHDYSNSYSTLYDNLLWELVYKAELPSSEFFDTQMESAFSDLMAAITTYVKSSTNRIWCDGNERANVPPEWLEEDQSGNTQQKRFDEAVEVMNKVATGVWEAYAQLIRAARSKLLAEEPPREAIDKFLNSKEIFQHYFKPHT